MLGKHDKRRCGLRKVIFVLVLHVFYVSGHVKQDDLIYMLMWTSSITDPFAWIDTDQDTFTSRKCLYQNCFITNDMAYFDDISDFDAILFNVVNLQSNLERPLVRSPKQIYIFVGMQSSSSHPVPDTYNGFFNRTWTYKLDSDIYFGHIIIKDNRDKIIGPKKNMHWMDVKHMRPITKYIKHKLRKKSIAAAWFASNCNTNSKREDFVRILGDELGRYGHQIDIFGSCGDLECPVDRMDECFALVETDYYFYLAFENSLSEDYVTEQVLFALEHFAVPVVYGGANYTRFMPDGIYLDAVKLGEAGLARKMIEVIDNIHEYYDFFKWHRYYSFHGTEESTETDVFCAFCATMNDLVQRNESSVYVSLSQWWNGNVQVIKSPGPNYRERIQIVPVTGKTISQPKHTRRKKKKNHRIQGKKPFRKIVSHTQTTGPVNNDDRDNKNVTTTTLTPLTQAKKQNTSEPIKPLNVNGSLDQAKGSGTWTKQEFEFEYDYER